MTLPTRLKFGRRTEKDREVESKTTNKSELLLTDKGFSGGLLFMTDRRRLNWGMEKNKNCPDLLAKDEGNYECDHFSIPSFCFSHHHPSETKPTEFWDKLGRFFSSTCCGGL
ncbi:E3 ubiquitin-protein ligase MARCH1 [Striga asiatica]|uniref:E3 ubiquitin-protein ligase MARCH1 n=1 Tax=Striga asiatica TaxID=4170 RepID=A0A5A7P9G1_STRAF|nr:E3 ubiquitin-protein ligase MARCH1 [Striga asiatica]